MLRPTVLFALIVQSYLPIITSSPTIAAQQPVNGPVLDVVGPKLKPDIRDVMLKIKFTGKDLKVTSNAPKDEYFLVKFFESTEYDVGLLFQPTKEGTYYFAFACNSNSKTAVALHVVVIGKAVPVPDFPPDPKPVIPLTEFETRMQQAFKTDIAAGVAKAEHRAAMIAAYKQGLKDFVPVAKTNKELFDKQKTLNETLIGVGTMPNVRQIIAADVSTVIGNNPSAAVDRSKIEPLWQKYITAFEKMVP
jgi:hypothetical protein